MDGAAGAVVAVAAGGGAVVPVVGAGAVVPVVGGGAVVPVVVGGTVVPSLSTIGTVAEWTGIEGAAATDPLMVMLRAGLSTALLSRLERARLVWVDEPLTWPLAMVTVPVRVLGFAVTPEGRVMV